MFQRLASRRAIFFIALAPASARPAGGSPQADQAGRQTCQASDEIQQGRVLKLRKTENGRRLILRKQYSRRIDNDS